MSFGAGLPIFTGSRYPVGSGLLGNIARIALPLLKSVGKTALRHGAQALSNTISDSISGGDNWKDAAIRNAKTMALNTARDVLPVKQQRRRNVKPPNPPRQRKRQKGRGIKKPSIKKKRIVKRLDIFAH